MIILNLTSLAKLVLVKTLRLVITLVLISLFIVNVTFYLARRIVTYITILTLGLIKGTRHELNT